MRSRRPWPACLTVVCSTSRLSKGLAGLTLIAASSASAQSSKIVISDAWTPAQEASGVDTPLYMTVLNTADGADSLLRAQCPVSLFTVKRTLDQGEGAPSARELKSIDIPAGHPTVLAEKSSYLMLLKTTESLPAGRRFSCSFTFRNAGKIEAEVAVKASPDSR